MVPLKPELADIILYSVSPRSDWSSKIIAIAQLILGRDKGLVEYSHVALYDRDGYQIESVFPRTIRSKVDTSRAYEIWGVHGATEDDRKKVMDWAYARIGELYDINYIVVAILTLGIVRLRIKGTEVCCTNVRDAWASAGHHMKGDRPDQIADNDNVFKKMEFKPK